MRLRGSRILTGLPAARGSGFGRSIHRFDPPASERESHSLSLGGSVPHENEERNWTGPGAAMPRRTRSFSRGTLLLRICATFPNWRSNSPSTAPSPDGAPRIVRIIHPFHPLFGREYQLVTYRKNWGEDRVYFHNEAGQFVAVPAHWTDLFPVDPFQTVAAGEAHFRPTELLLLAELIERQQSAPNNPTPDGGSHVR